MGFLGFGNYNKPGPGINKDEPPKAAPVRFFEIFFRKFWKFVQANLLFAIPATAALLIAMAFYLFIPFHGVLNLGTVTTIDLNLMLLAPIPMVLLSPFTAGLTFISRNFSREEHAFIWTDFVKAVKGNIKFFLLNGLICYGAFVFMGFALTYYYSMLGSGWFFYLPMALCMAFTLIFLFAQYYIPVMLVTFELTFKQAYKNAFIFAALGIGRNFLLTILTALLLVGSWFMLMSNLLLVSLFFVICVFILFAFYNYLVTFTVYPVIDKYLIKPYHERENGDAEPEKGKTSAQPFPSETFEEDDEDGYVYVNGKMVKKSDFKNE